MSSGLIVVIESCVLYSPRTSLWNMALLSLAAQLDRDSVWWIGSLCAWRSLNVTILVGVQTSLCHSLRLPRFDFRYWRVSVWRGVVSGEQALQYLERATQVTAGKKVTVLAKREGHRIHFSLREGAGSWVGKAPWLIEWGGGASVESPHYQVQSTVWSITLLQVWFMQIIRCVSFVEPFAMLRKTTMRGFVFAWTLHVRSMLFGPSPTPVFHHYLKAHTIKEWNIRAGNYIIWTRLWEFLSDVQTRTVSGFRNPWCKDEPTAICVWWEALHTTVY